MIESFQWTETIAIESLFFKVDFEFAHFSTISLDSRLRCSRRDLLEKAECFGILKLVANSRVTNLLSLSFSRTEK